MTEDKLRKANVHVLRELKTEPRACISTSFAMFPALAIDRTHTRVHERINTHVMLLHLRLACDTAMVPFRWKCNEAVQHTFAQKVRMEGSDASLTCMCVLGGGGLGGPH